MHSYHIYPQDVYKEAVRMQQAMAQQPQHGMGPTIKNKYIYLNSK